MKVYTGEHIRNVTILGHGGTGETSLTAAMLHLAGATTRLGRVDDGSTVTDWTVPSTNCRAVHNHSALDHIFRPSLPRIGSF